MKNFPVSKMLFVFTLQLLVYSCIPDSRATDDYRDTLKNTFEKNEKANLRQGLERMIHALNDSIDIYDRKLKQVNDEKISIKLELNRKKHQLEEIAMKAIHLNNSWNEYRKNGVSEAKFFNELEIFLDEYANKKGEGIVSPSLSEGEMKVFTSIENKFTDYKKSNEDLQEENKDLRKEVELYQNRIVELEKFYKERIENLENAIANFKENLEGENKELKEREKELARYKKLYLDLQTNQDKIQDSLIATANRALEKVSPIKVSYLQVVPVPKRKSIKYKKGKYKGRRIESLSVKLELVNNRNISLQETQTLYLAIQTPEKHRIIGERKTTEIAGKIIKYTEAIEVDNLPHKFQETYSLEEFAEGTYRVSIYDNKSYEPIASQTIQVY